MEYTVTYYEALDQLQNGFCIQSEAMRDGTYIDTIKTGFFKNKLYIFHSNGDKVGAYIPSISDMKIKWRYFKHGEPTI